MSLCAMYKWINNLIRNLMDYPVLNCNFIVEWSGQTLELNEVSGLEMEIDVVYHRDGNSREDEFTKQPGLRHFSPLIFKRSIRAGNNDFFEWIDSVKTDPSPRRDLKVSLLDGHRNPVRSWIIKGAWPYRLEGPELIAGGEETAFEQLYLAHEGFSIEVENDRKKRTKNS